MKLFEKVEEIFDKYNLTPIKLPDEYENVYQYLDKHPDEKWKFESDKDDFYLIKKYRNYIPRGHYGFSLGTPISSNWIDIIEEILALCIKEDPKFEIHQIKMKYGGVCFYVNSNVIEDIYDIERLIMKKLFDQSLIY